MTTKKTASKGVGKAAIDMAPVFTHRNIGEALMAAQADFPRLVKATVGQDGNRKFLYVTYDQIVEELGPILRKHQILYFHLIEKFITTDNDNGKVVEYLHQRMVTTIKHVPSGTILASSMFLTADGPGQKDMGKAITYTQRYTLKSLIGCATGDDIEDDTPEGADVTMQVGAREASMKQVGMIGHLFDELGWDDKKRASTVQKLTKGRTSNAAEISGPEATVAIKRLQQLKEEQDNATDEPPM